MDRIRVPGEIHRMNPVIREVSLEPFHRPAVRGQAVLAKQVFPQSTDIRSIKQRFMLIGHKIQGSRTLQPFLQGDIVKVSLFVRMLTQPWPGCLLPAKARVLVKIALHQLMVGQVFEIPATK